MQKSFWTVNQEKEQKWNWCSNQKDPHVSVKITEAWGSFDFIAIVYRLISESASSSAMIVQS